MRSRCVPVASPPRTEEKLKASRARRHASPSAATGSGDDRRHGPAAGEGEGLVFDVWLS